MQQDVCCRDRQSFIEKQLSERPNEVPTTTIGWRSALHQSPSYTRNPSDIKIGPQNSPSIMAVLGDIEVIVQVDDEDLTEYSDEESRSSDTSITKYIGAISGAEFAVNFQMHTSHKFVSDALDVYVYLDGNESQDRFIRREWVARDSQNVRYERYFQGPCKLKGKDWEKRRFCFSDIDMGKQNRSFVLNLLTGYS